MKVLDLQCAQGHAFEGWFASQDDYDAQRTRGLVTCPVCNDSDIVKKLSAPRLNLAAPSDALQQMQAALMQTVRHVMANTEDVGAQFAEEARKIHYGESAERNIRGQASREETAALIDEGIAVVPLPLPDKPQGPLH
jgi:hypothetical protein